MNMKKTWTTLALVAVFAMTLAAVGYTSNALACDKKAKAEGASAAKAGCCAKSAKSASASTCPKSAKSASASTCPKSAKTASASTCTKSAKSASASTCTKSAKTASASMCGKSAAADRACCNSAKADKLAAELKGIVDEVPHMERYRVVVAGSMECSHCTYDATAKCQPLLKTTDGKVYPLLKSNLVQRMRKSDAKSFEISSNVRLINGVKYLEVKSYKSL